LHRQRLRGPRLSGELVPPNCASRIATAPRSLGPWLVDAGDVADPANLNLRTFVNGKLTQAGNTRDLIFDIPF
jgi:5-oxopent-3-ene-1,2,5-tricarboxylate decarboxylase/2-hydroxyhepta-2,4-diene-1,7-dioate isomerase